MKVSTERIPDSQVVLEIEVEQERLELTLEKAYRRLVQRTEVPGFRKGKAPRSMLERHLGRHRLLHEALDILVPEIYDEALAEHGIEAIDAPRIEVVQEEPPVIKATVPLRPTVELGDYPSLRVARPPVEATQAEVDEAVEELRHRYALREPVQRPLRVGDIVRLDVRAQVDGRQVFVDEDAEFRLRDGAPIFFPGFVEELVGTNKGDTAQFSLAIPEDYPQEGLAGKPCAFTVTVHEIKEERLPDPNDDFAREVGEGFASLLALRQRLRGDISDRKAAAAEEEYRNEAVSALTAAAVAVEFPPVLVEREIERLLREEARAAGSDVERYLQQRQKLPQEIREELWPIATERVKRSLALTRLAELEGISVDPSEVDGEIERLAGGAGPQGEEVRRLFANPAGRDAIQRSLLTRKTLDRLVAIVSQGDISARKPAKAKKRTAVSLPAQAGSRGGKK